jgi:hypothetical protein
MEIREISAQEITRRVRDLCIEANIGLGSNFAHGPLSG